MITDHVETFTPGPWTWDGKFTVGIPHAMGDTFFRTNPEDARLIAAAPELLAACVFALNAFAEDEAPSVQAALRAAIAKAEGRQ